MTSVGECFGLVGFGHELHQFDAHAVGIGDEILLALAASGSDAVGIDVEAPGFEIVERGRSKIR